MSLENLLQEFRKPFKDRKNFDLEKIKVLLNLLDNPQNKFLSVHIAGTNGKGSVSSMLHNVLKELGFKTGLFTSPHLERFTERIKINDTEISEEDFLRILNEKILPIINNLDKNRFDPPTEFEIITLITFYYFSEQNIDIGVIEAGLGGRYDATNTLENTILSVITNISLDHTDRLGSDVQSVTYHKVGIIKENTPIITTELNSEKDIFYNEAKNKNNSKLYFVNPENIKSFEINFEHKKAKRKYTCDDKNSLFYNQTLSLNLVADYQKENISLVLKALDLLYFSLNEINMDKKEYISKCIKGLEESYWGGRFEYFNINEYNIILDGAHNDNGMKAFTDSLKYLPQKTIITIFACNKDKNYLNMINTISNISEFIILTKSHVEIKAKDPEQISSYLKNMNKDHKIVKDYRQTIDFACKIITDRNYDKKNVLICVCGSLYLIGGIRQHINSLDI